MACCIERRSHCERMSERVNEREDLWPSPAAMPRVKERSALTDSHGATATCLLHMWKYHRSIGTGTGTGTIPRDDWGDFHPTFRTRDKLPVSAQGPPLTGPPHPFGEQRLAPEGRRLRRPPVIGSQAVSLILWETAKPFADGGGSDRSELSLNQVCWI